MVIVLRIQLAYSLVVAIGIELLRSRGVWGQMQGIIVRTGQSAQVLISVVMVIYFKQMLEASQAVDGFHQGLSQLGVPPLVLLVVLPFSIGLMTGLTIAFVGVSFPILLPIITGGDNIFVYLMLAYASGYCGVLLSPLHLCLVLTKDYFKAELRKVYHLLLAPVGVVWGVALLLFSLFALGIFT
jgi:integral membrane protein (TIGR00529 family)